MESPNSNKDTQPPPSANEIILPVECGPNKATLYLSRLCQGSRGPCVMFRGSWLTPNEFQYVSGRETAKDWKRSIRHGGKSLKLLVAKGVMSLNPPRCGCDNCGGTAVSYIGKKSQNHKIIYSRIFEIIFRLDNCRLTQ